MPGRGRRFPGPWSSTTGCGRRRLRSRGCAGRAETFDPLLGAPASRRLLTWLLSFWVSSRRDAGAPRKGSQEGRQYVRLPASPAASRPLDGRPPSRSHVHTGSPPRSSRADPRLVSPARPGGRGAAALLRQPGELSPARTGRGALRRDPARDAGERRLRVAASERGALFREAPALLLAERGGSLAARGPRPSRPAVRGFLRLGGGWSGLAAGHLDRG